MDTMTFHELNAQDAPIWYCAGFVLALGLSLYLTPMLRDVAIKAGIVDRPDGGLKKHRQPVAYLGGLAIYLAFLLTLGMSPLVTPQVLALLLAGTVILLLGLIDDLKALSPTVKLLGQLLAAFVLIKTGIRIQVEAFGAFSDVLTILWIVGVTNAFNLIDVTDGLAGGAGLVVLLFLFAVAVVTGNVSNALFTITLAGAVLGFLRFNVAPAQIYLGDAGSMLIGFFTGALAMLGSYAEHNRWAVVAPLLLLGVPLFDTVFVTIHRLRRGLSPFRGSPDHFAVRLRAAGVSDRRVAFGAWVATALLGGAALWLMRLDAFESKILLGGVVLAVVAAAVALSAIGRPVAAKDPGEERSGDPKGI